MPRCRGLPAPQPITRLHAIELSEAWRRRLGPCEVDTRGELFRVRHCALEYAKGGLTLAYSLDAPQAPTADSVRLALLPLDDRRAIVPGFGTSEGNGVTVTLQAGTEALRYSGFVIALNVSR